MYTDREKELIWLDSFNLGHKKNKILISYMADNSLFSILKESKSELEVLLSKKVIENMILSINSEYIDKCISLLDYYNVKAVTYLSDDYPERLKEIPSSPLVLYTKGDVKLLNYDKMLAIVGTRKPSRYGRDMAKWFAGESAKNKVVTVSGLAYGIDSEVAINTLSVGGKTIAVLAGGLDSIYPKTNTDLANKIVESGGLLVSEHAPRILPVPYAFPERNRIISGLSLGTLIIEAGENSGSLITANFAIDQNRDLYVVPGNLDSIQFKGSNDLIAKFPHAFVSSPQDLLKNFGIVPEESIKKEETKLVADEEKIVDVLSSGEIHFDDILDETKFDAKKLNSLLTSLEIRGIIKKLPNNYYSL